MIAQVKTDYLQLDGGQLYYETAGEGEPLVLGHAGFVDSGMWDTQWQTLARHFRVIRYDMRGYGKSSPVSGPVSRRDELYQLLEHLGVERAYLMGCSLGGGMLLDFALEHPQMAAALILVSAVPGGFELQGPPPPHLLDMIAAMQQGDLARASELQIRIWVDGPFRQPEQVDPAVRRRAAVMNRIPVERGTWAIADMPPLHPPAVQRLSDIHIPILVIAGALDHPEILRGVDVMAAGIRGAQKVIIPDSAHVPNMEKPVEFNLAVIEFLAALSE